MFSLDNRPRRRGLRVPRRAVPLLVATCTLFAFASPGVWRNYKINGPLPVQAIGQVQDTYALSDDGSVVAYAVSNHVFVRPTDLSAPPLDVSGQFAGVDQIELTGDGSSVLIRGTRDWNDSTELFWAPADGSISPVRMHGFLSLDVVNFALTPDDAFAVFKVWDDYYSTPVDGSAAAVLLTDPLGPGEAVRLGLHFTPDSSRLVYEVQDVFVFNQILSVPVDGSQPPSLVTGSILPGEDIGVYAISPDGSLLAYVAPADSSAKELYVAPTDGSAPPIKLSGTLVSGGDVTHCVIAPDNTVVYRADQDTNGVHALYAVPADGSQPAVRLTPPPPAGGDVTTARILVTPDSTQVLYRADHDTNNVFELFVAPLDGSQIETKISAPTQPNGDVAANQYELTPDGTRVVYRADQELDAVQELFSVPMDGSQVSVKLNDPLFSDRNVTQWELSGDGDWVAYRADLGADEEFDLFLVPADGSGPAVMANPPLGLLQEVESFAFSPDGTYLALRADEKSPGGFELFGLPSHGNGPGQLLNAPLDCEPGGGIADWKVSSDGEFIVFQGNQNSPAFTELHGRRLDGRGPVVRYNETHPAGGLIGEWDISPDGQKVVYEQAQGLFSTSIDGTTSPVQINPPLPPNGEIGTFRLVPDSERVAYTADPEINNKFDLYSARLDALGDPVNLSDLSIGSVTSIAMPPNTGRVVYVADAEVNDQYELFSAPLDGSAAPVKLSGPMIPDGNVWDVRFFTPGGERVVWRADANVNERYDIFSAPVDGSAPAVMISGPLTPGGSVSSSRQAMSPDGTRFVYVADQDTDGVNELYSAFTDGSAPAVKLNGPLGAAEHVFEFDISPDGERVAFTAGPTNQRKLYSAPIDGSVPPAVLSPATASRSALDPLISHDSTRVVYRADDASEFVLQLNAVPIDGSAPAEPLTELAGDDDVLAARIAGNSGLVLYTAAVGGVIELFAVPVTGGPSIRINGPLSPGGGVNNQASGFAWVPFGPRVVYEADQEHPSALELFATELLPGVRPGAVAPAGAQQQVGPSLP